jgi:predicted tellurium resistance membrane protein TerC
MKRNRMVMRGLMFALVAALAVAVFGFVVMSLWNWLMPPLFGWKLLTFWQAIGLLILSKILLGGFRGHSGGHGRWRHRMRERWEHMTPEEREKFRAGFAGRCGRVEPPVARPTA